MPVTKSGFNGAGQSITLVGQSAIVVSDIEAFQSASGLTVKDPNQYLVPSSGAAALSDGDEAESDLDIEWSGAIATGATINFVYAGNNPTYGAFDAIQYAIDQNIGTIISSSYGTCETALAGFTLESSLEQAATQGQTVMSAAGDDGSTDCSGITGISGTDQTALAVDYPASSQYVTGMGGTEVSSTADNGDYLIVGDGYWEANNGASDIVSSVQQYIPEIAWNDDALSVSYGNGLASGGGGASALFSKPTWQTGVPGIPSDGKRDVPDLALYASPFNPGYLFCSSDSGSNGPWQSNQQSSCTAGFEDSASGDLTAAGGTSFDAPIFSGMLALLSQKAGYGVGQGEGPINKTLYSLASNAATYLSAFHDITSGNNDCLGGSSLCSGDPGFSAGVGYDQATGLGSVDLANLAAVWPANTDVITPALTASTTTITASNSSLLVGVSDNFTIAVTAASGTPTGSVTITVDDNAPITETLTSNGTYVYQTSFSTADTHTVFAAYVANSTYAASTASASVSVGVNSSGSGSISFKPAPSPSTLTVAQGSSGVETLSITPAGGYTGTVDLSIDAGSADTTLQNLCWQYTSTDSAGNGIVQIASTTAVSTQLTFYTSGSYCASAGAMRNRTIHSLRKANTAANTGGNPAPLGVAFAGLLLAGFLGRRSRKLRGLAALIVLGAMGLALSACGNNNSISTTVSDPPKGTYTITVTGQDSATATITATSTFTFVID
jgi:hypothetical protein